MSSPQKISFFYLFPGTTMGTETNFLDTDEDGIVEAYKMYVAFTLRGKHVLFILHYISFS